MTIELQLPYRIQVEGDNGYFTQTTYLDKEIETFIPKVNSIRDTEFASMDKDDLLQYVINLYEEPLTLFRKSGLDDIVSISNFDTRGYSIDYVLYNEQEQRVTGKIIAQSSKQRSNSNWLYNEVRIHEYDPVKKSEIGCSFIHRVREDKWKVRIK